jgi:hypothetical protein
MERDYAKTLAPTPLQAVPAETPAPLRVYRLRVWADADYRGQIWHWERRLDDQVARVNEFLGPSFGVKLVVAEVRNWDRKAPDKDLEGPIGELATIDDGKDVDWVVGLVAPLPLVTGTQHRIGLARFFQSYFVLRGMVDALEAAQLDRVFVHLPEESAKSSTAIATCTRRRASSSTSGRTPWARSTRSTRTR